MSPAIAVKNTAAGYSSTGGPLVQLCFAFGLTFLMPGFVLTLAVDPVTLEFHGSRILQAANLYCGVYAVATILTSREMTNTVLQCRPVLLLIGFAFASCIWSFNPGSTIQGSVVFATTSLFAMAMAGRLSTTACLRLTFGTMAFACFLSILWVLLLPQQGVHQATDLFQFQHAGLWRGIFTHKQGLGVTAGLTTALLLFYRSTIFSSPVVGFAAIGCSLVCLIGTQSATGMLVAVTLFSLLYLTYRIACSQPSTRKGMLATLAGIMAFGFVCFYLGILDFVMPLIGKSVDLTGRADFWPWVLLNIKNSGSALLGGGFNGGWESVVATSVSIDSGYIMLLVWFGYFGAAVVLTIYGWLVWAGAKLILTARADNAALQVFPFCIMVAELILNVTEPTFMGKSINTVLITVAACHIIKFKKGVRM